MKTYKQLMEVMSISDMNKIKGGTDAQRKIAQDRQKRREAKDKGFDPKKSVMADGSKPSEEQKTAPKDGALVKTTGLAKQDRKPDLRKSQLGKWSEGAKKSPGALAKKAASAVTKTDPVEKVDVKVHKRDGSQGQQGTKPGTSRTSQSQQETQEVEKGKPKKGNLGKHLKNLGKKIGKAALDYKPKGEVETYGEGPGQGLQQRGNSVAS